jgi:hypothetical protein
MVSVMQETLGEPRLLRHTGAVHHVKKRSQQAGGPFDWRSGWRAREQRIHLLAHAGPCRPCRKLNRAGRSSYCAVPHFSECKNRIQGLSRAMCQSVPSLFEVLFRRVRNQAAKCELVRLPFVLTHDFAKNAESIQPGCARGEAACGELKRNHLGARKSPGFNRGVAATDVPPCKDRHPAQENRRVDAVTSLRPIKSGGPFHETGYRIIRARNGNGRQAGPDAEPENTA